MDAAADTSGAEGSAIPFSGNASDPDGDVITLSWSVTTPPSDGGSCSFSAPASALTDITCDDDGTVEATLTADDGINPPVSDTVSLDVANVAPSLALDSGNGEPVPVNQLVPISGSVADPRANDTLTRSFDWDDGGAVEEVAPTGGECALSQPFLPAGIYSTLVTVTDDDGASSSYETLVVVYDPSGGFVTGGAGSILRRASMSPTLRSPGRRFSVCRQVQASTRRAPRVPR